MDDAAAHLGFTMASYVCLDRVVGAFPTVRQAFTP